MNLLTSLIAILVLTLLALGGAFSADLAYFLTVIIPYVAVSLFPVSRNKNSLVCVGRNGIFDCDHYVAVVSYITSMGGTFVDSVFYMVVFCQCTKC